MSEEQNSNNSTVTTTASNSTPNGSGDWFNNLPPPGSDPFGADESDEITLIGGRPEPVEQKNRTQQTESDENNIDFDELLSDTVSINNEEQKPQAKEQLPQTTKQEQPQDFKTALDDYGLSVVDSLFNAENFAKQLTESDPNAIALTLKKSLSEMYQRCLQDSLLVARRFADDALKSAAKNQQEQFSAREQAQILKSTLAPYPDLSKATYKPVVKTVYEKALAKGKTPQEAANLVVAYFRKNIPNAIQEPAQTKQTDGSSINDIWANFR